MIKRRTFPLIPIHSSFCSKILEVILNGKVHLREKLALYIWGVSQTSRSSVASLMFALKKKVQCAKTNLLKSTAYCIELKIVLYIESVIFYTALFYLN